MSYQVSISAAASRSLSKIDRSIRSRIDRAIIALAENPCPSGCKKLAGTHNGWRIRIGDWRVLYTIDDGKLVVIIVEAAHRRDVYRDL